jgi:hypothetical protein
MTTPSIGGENLFFLFNFLYKKNIQATLDIRLLLSRVLLPNIEDFEDGPSNLRFCPLSVAVTAIRFLTTDSGGPIFRRVLGSFDRARR